MKSIYETKFDTVIEWIDEHVAIGFYPLFDKRFRFGWRVANLILHDELRWLAIKIDNAYNEKDLYGGRRFDHNISKIKKLSDNISMKGSE